MFLEGLWLSRSEVSSPIALGTGTNGKHGTSFEDGLRTRAESNPRVLDNHLLAQRLQFQATFAARGARILGDTKRSTNLKEPGRHRVG